MPGSCIPTQAHWIMLLFTVWSRLFHFKSDFPAHPTSPISSHFGQFALIKTNVRPTKWLNGSFLQKEPNSLNFSAVLLFCFVFFTFVALILTDRFSRKGRRGTGAPDLRPVAVMRSQNGPLLLLFPSFGCWNTTMRRANARITKREFWHW